jgi:3-deoxy-D-manno-octulosonic-acid transferase
VPPSFDLPPESDLGGRFAYAAYDVATAAATLACLPLLPWVRGRLGGEVLQRLGRLPASFRSLRSAPLWVHAASVGEALAATPLVAEIRRQRPGMPIVVSTTTVTGRAVALRELDADAVTLLPVDAWRIVDRVFQRVRPRGLVVIETEIWPGLLRAAGRVGANPMLVSGRLSARTLRRYRLAGPLFPAAIQRITVFCMQTDDDAKRIMALGAPAERVHVTGSLKGARRAESRSEEPVAGLQGRPVIVAASTQPSEEEFVLAACRRLWAEFPGLLLILAPRRPERFAEADRLAARAGLRYQRRSVMGDEVSSQTQVLLLDTVGELPRFLPSARAVFVGGTVASLGGHNVLEPATHAKPVAFGPNTQNVAAAADALIAAGGGQRVHQPIDLERFWARFLAEPAQAALAGERARRVALTQSDVVARTWACVEPFLGAGE